MPSTTLQRQKKQSLCHEWEGKKRRVVPNFEKADEERTGGVRPPAGLKKGGWRGNRRILGNGVSPIVCRVCMDSVGQRKDIWRKVSRPDNYL